MAQTQKRQEMIKFLMAGGILAELALVIASTGSGAIAQIIPDQTLGSENSQVIRNTTIRGLPGDRIDGGALRGTNLFHSFSEFNVNEGQRVYFANPSGVETILSRVTGSHGSDILGTLGVDGGANLFLLNPNGIVFGTNARLDIRGSLVVSTGDRFTFPDGSEFSATHPQVAPLLSVNIPPGLQLGRPRGNVTSNAALMVPPGESLVLQGNLTQVGGSLIAPGGTVQVLGDRIALLDHSRIDVSSPAGGGMVFIGGDAQGRGTLPTASRTFIAPAAAIAADALVNGNGGRVVVWSNEVTGFYGTITAQGGQDAGNGGQVEVSGRSHLMVRGDVNTRAVRGITGTLLLDPTNIIIADGTNDSADDGDDTFAGNNSDIEGSILSTPLSTINDTEPTTIYESELEGLADSNGIVLQATNDITINDLTDDALDLDPGDGTIQFQADSDGNGMGAFTMNPTDIIYTNGYDILISAATINLGSIDTTDLDDETRSGLVTITATNDINLTGGIDVSLQNPTLDDFGRIDLTSTTGSVILNNSTLSASNTAGGFSGDIFINAASQVLLNDSTIKSEGYFGRILIGNTNPGNDDTPPPPNSRPVPQSISINRSTISSNTGTARADARGVGELELNATTVQVNQSIITATTNSTVDTANDGGSITFNADNLTIRNSLLNASTSGTGDAGEVTFDVSDRILLDTGTRIASDVIDSGTGQSGNIELNTDHLTLLNGSVISSLIFGNSDIATTGNITITAQTVRLGNLNSPTARSGITTSVQATGSGRGGSIRINSDSLHLIEGAYISSDLFGQGDAGQIEINAQNLIRLISDSEQAPSSISTSVVASGVGQGGSILMNSNSLVLTGTASISATTSGRGNAGNIRINANDRIVMNQSTISSDVNRTGVGRSGEINLTTDSLTLTNGAQISSSILGQGDSRNAGEIVINADDVRLEAASNQEFGSSIFTSVERSGSGRGGTIRVNADSLSLRGNAALNAATLGQGNAGSILVTVARSLSLTDGAEFNAETRSRSRAGSIRIRANQVTLNNNSALTVSGSQGQAGNLTIDAPAIRLDDNSALDASTGAGRNGGNIRLENVELLFLRNQSSISARAINQANGGNVTINAVNGNVIAIPQEDNDILASAVGGNGGRIDITTQLILGLDQRNPVTDFSDINASSQFGADGFIAIRTPGVDPAQGLVELPADIVDPSSLVTQECSGSAPRTARRRSSFVISGRGGLPPAPDDAQSQDGEAIPWVTRSATTSQPNTPAAIAPPETIPTPEIVEAQGWVTDTTGSVQLTANAATGSDRPAPIVPTVCPSP